MQLDRIVSDPDRCEGLPHVRNTWLTVERVLTLVEQYVTWDALCTDFPELDHEDIRQCLLWESCRCDDKLAQATPQSLLALLSI